MELTGFEWNGINYRTDWNRIKINGNKWNKIELSEMKISIIELNEIKWN